MVLPGTPLIWNAMTETFMLKPKATLRSDGCLPRPLRTFATSLFGVPRNCAPLMLCVVTGSPPISAGISFSRSALAWNEGMAKLEPGSPDAAGASVDGASVGVADVDVADVGPVVAVLPLQATT